MMLRTIAAAALVSASVSIAAADNDDSIDLSPIVVTATRTAIPSDQVLAPVIVIDRDEIERSQAIDVTGLLRFHGGVEVARNGGPGQLTSIFIRGAESDHTLVLVDGVRINSGTSGAAAIQNMSADLVESTSSYGLFCPGRFITFFDTSLLFPCGPIPVFDLKFGSAAHFADFQASNQRIWSEGPRSTAFF